MQVVLVSDQNSSHTTVPYSCQSWDSRVSVCRGELKDCNLPRYRIQGTGTRYRDIVYVLSGAAPPDSGTGSGAESGVRRSRGSLLQEASCARKEVPGYPGTLYPGTRVPGTVHSTRYLVPGTAEFQVARNVGAVCCPATRVPGTGYLPSAFTCWLPPIPGTVPVDIYMFRRQTLASGHGMTPVG